MTGTRRLAALAALLLLITACGDDSVLRETTVRETSTTVGSTQASTSTSEPGSTTTTEPVVSTTAMTMTTTSTTVAPEDTIPEDPFSVDALSSIEAQPQPLPDDVSALLSGRPEEAVAAAIAAGLEATGLDLTGVEVAVWPIIATGESLLILWFDDTATAFAGEDVVADDLLATLIDSPYVDGASITRLVINYRSEDADGPFVLTATVSIATVREALASGRDLEQDEMQLQVTRPEDQ